MSRSAVVGGLAIGVVLALPAFAQPIVEFAIPTPNCGAGGITAGPDGALWFTEATANQIGRIATDGAVTEFPLPAGSIQPRYIAAGPDGALWFTEADDQGGFRIGRMTTAGAVTEVPLAADHDPGRIVAGPDGNLWFVVKTHLSYVFLAGLVSRIDTAGAVTDFALDLDYIGGLAAGPDGNIWFTRIGGTQHGQFNLTLVNRLTPTGVLSSFYYDGFGQSLIGAIAAGADGNLWFAHASPSSAEVGRVTTQGTLTGQFPISDFLSAITAGSDGALWFVQYNSNRVGRITTGGDVNEYPVPTAASGPTDIAAGPDGAIWFTESAANQIGRLFPESPTPTPLPTVTPTVTPAAGPTTVPALSTTSAALLALLLAVVGFALSRHR